MIEITIEEAKQLKVGTEYVANPVMLESAFVLCWIPSAVPGMGQGRGEHLPSDVAATQEMHIE